MDINAAFPPPANPEPGSPEALLKAVLDVAAADGGSWLEGRHVYHTRVMEGATDQQAMYEAANAAAHSHEARVRQALEHYYSYYAGNNGSNGKGPKRRFETLRGVFGPKN